MTVKPDTKGILNPSAGGAKFQLERYAPGQGLGYFVQQYWIVEWDLRGSQPYLQEILPYPCMHLVFEKDKTAIFGVVTGKFANLLEGQGRAFGVKFRPAGFYPFVQAPVSTFTDTTIRLEEAFGVDSKALEQAILSQADHDTMVELAEQFLRARLPAQDPHVELINRIVDRIAADRSITRVDDIARQFSLSKRTVQRIFSQYVGVGPKWVVKRYRLQEAADQLADGGAVDWPRLALELGYFDQAHFIKDFKTIVGRTPAEYARSVGEGS
jgi:AraC-like DNA-binding protein